jgi:MerR family transcriptional regulator, copper efflux regulator
VRTSELAKRSGLSVDTIRFYEKKGLIDCELIRRQTNNYRDYSEASLERLMLIKQAKRLGFTLAEVQEWIRDFESKQLTIQERQTILGRKLEQIDERIEELKTMKSHLVVKIENLQK